LGGERAALVEAVMPFLDEWQALLKDVQRLTPERVSLMLDRAEELRDQADRAGQGAIVHQLEVCIASLRAPAVDRRAVLESLRSLSEVCWQLKQEVAPRHPSDAAARSLAQPPLLSEQPGSPGGRSQPGSPAARGVEPPPPLSLPGAALPPARHASPLGLGASRVALPPNLDASRVGGLASPGVHAAPRNFPANGFPADADAGAAPRRSAIEPPLVEAQPRAEPRPPEEVDALFQRAAPAPRGGSARPAGPPILSLGGKKSGAGPAAAPAPRAKDKPNLMVATMFGLRAFGRNGSKGAAAAPGQRAPSAPPQPQRISSHGPPKQGAQRGAGVLGLGQRSNISDQPGWIGERAGGLPELPKAGYRNAAERAASELDDSFRAGRSADDARGDRRSKPPTIPPGERRGRPSTYPPGADRVRSGSRGDRDRDRGERSDRFVRVDRGREGSLPVPWWIGGVAVAVVGLVVVGLLVLGRTSSTARDGAATQAAETTDETPLPTSKLLDEKERMRALISSVHDLGGGESPELADLVNEEAALVNEVLQKSCDKPGDKCERAVPMIAGTALSTTTPQNKMHQLFEDRKITSTSRGTGGKVPQWLAGLQVPAIGVGDNPMVRQKVTFFTETQNGREEFQNLLFRCGAYRDLIERSLVDAGLPKSLLALVMTESGCNAHAESPVGARGLWQFMPATGRAYHLHIKENIVDERVSPRKSSAAAVRYLADLRRKMGSWEFAMASYNMGPFGLASRIRRAGGDVTFWDLAENGFLPDETAKYVPRIQAYALILENLAKFNFSTFQERATEMTDELHAPGGTRLSMIARAASTSFDHLKLLNPDIVGASVPELGGERFMVQVPRNDAERARSVLESLLNQGNEQDLCVSSGFDWGSERFSDDMCGGGEVRPRRRQRR
jgi:hypothetical protein